MLSPDAQNKLREKLQPIASLIESIKQADGLIFVVGGAVRDLIIGKRFNDLDMEVHNLDIEELEKLLKDFGPVSFVGKKFGVFKLHNKNIDISIPRSDSKGRKPDVTLDPHMGITQALRRRDITMNAMAINVTNLESFEITDPFGGQNDIKNNTIRAVDTKLFIEDPLRFFRVMHFAGRFQMQPDDELNELCKQMELSPDDIAIERIHEEVRKLCVKSEKPSIGFIWIRTLGRLDEFFPELAALSATEFDKTMQALDRAAQTDRKRYEKMAFCLTTLCHKLGKTHTKTLLQRLTATIKLHKICQFFLKKLPAFNTLIVDEPNEIKFFAWKIAHLISLQDLTLLASVIDPAQMEHAQRIAQKAEELGVFKTPEPSIVKGRDIIHSVKDRTLMGKLLSDAYRLQLSGIKDKKSLLAKILPT